MGTTKKLNGNKTSSLHFFPNTRTISIIKKNLFASSCELCYFLCTSTFIFSGKVGYRQIHRNCPQRRTPFLNGGSAFRIHQHKAPKRGFTSRIHQHTAPQKGVRLQISSTKKGVRLQGQFLWYILNFLNIVPNFCWFCS